MPETTHTSLSGPAGDLEVMLTMPHQAYQSVALLCHPHPLYGGSMHDGVLQLAANSLLQQEIAVIRFNFRGVGNSQGISGQGSAEEKAHQQYRPPEVGDLLAITAWARSSYDSIPLVYLGYSFGAYVLWHALPLLNDDQALLIAPPSAAMVFETQNLQRAAGLHAVWCEGDDFVDPSRFTEDTNVTTTQLAGGDHFFSNQTRGLATAVQSVFG